MKRFYQTLLFCLVLPLWTHAQNDTTQTTPGKFTLDQCIQYAMEHTIELQNARVDEKISESKVKETIGIGLPQIDASVGLVHNPSLPRMFGKNTNSENGGFSFFNNQAGEGDVVAAQNFF